MVYFIVNDSTIYSIWIIPRNVTYHCEWYAYFTRNAFFRKFPENFGNLLPILISMGRVSDVFNLDTKLSSCFLITLIVIIS